jgi:hypothetical protein
MHKLASATFHNRAPTRHWFICWSCKTNRSFCVAECACKRLSFQLRNLLGDFRHQMSDSVIVDLLLIKTRIICPEDAQIKNTLRFSRKCNQTPDQTKRLPST